MRGRFQEPRRHISLRTVLIALGVLVLAAAAFGVWKFTRPAPLPEIAVPVMQSQPVEPPAQRANWRRTLWSRRRPRLPSSRCG